jgi:mannosyl-3-phosphoglycerate phosphatase family protein
MGKPVIFTDLDGTLLDSSTYSFEPALPALRLIGELDIPIVFCSSKTRDEIECFRGKLGNRHPFITENGGGIVIPSRYFNARIFPRELTVVREKECLTLRLGASYPELRRAIVELRSEGFRITGFGDMSVADVAELTNLSPGQARLAKKRDFDEPFLFDGDQADIIGLTTAVRSKGFNLTRGRFFHLLGDSDKGKAVAFLIDLYREKYGTIHSIAVGDGLNDIPMLEQVNHPILVRRPDNSHAPDIDIPKLIKAEGIGPLGWNSALLDLLSTLEPECRKAPLHSPSRGEVLPACR